MEKASSLVKAGDVRPNLYCRPCEAFTSDNDAMIELGSEFPSGGYSAEIEEEIKPIWRVNARGLRLPC